jgi:homocitrate synthase NifV
LGRDFVLIKITDITLSCLDEYDAPSDKLKKLCEFLVRMGVDFIEMSTDAYRKIKDLPENGKYILKIKNREEFGIYAGFSRYSCKHIRFAASPDVISEIQLNDVQEIASLKLHAAVLENIRVVGLDDIIGHDYINAFNNMKSGVCKRLELCPENGCYCASAIAVEWLMQGGSYAASSFCGIGGKAATEEIIMALKLEKKYKVGAEFPFLPQMREVIEEITGEKISCGKPVVGDGIFDVEAGIHVDGISKDPKIYEPFSPEIVGGKRKLVIGKHSGRSALLLKMNELGINPKEVDLKKLLCIVQKASIKKNASLSDEEFKRICHNIWGK